MREDEHNEERLGAAAEAAEWDARYSEREDAIWSGRPNGRLLVEVAGLTPGRALDVGCGEGADAIWLARNGWEALRNATASRALSAAARRSRCPLGLGQGETVQTEPGGNEDQPSAPIVQALDRRHGQPGERRDRSIASSRRPTGVAVVMRRRSRSHERHEHNS
jgi:SAM-dependent methyltransferase